MIRLKFLLLVSFVLCTSQVFSAEAVNGPSLEYLKKGHYQAGGNFNYNSSARTGETILSINTLLGYFIYDRISLNGQASLFDIQSSTTGSYGVGTSYYFLDKGSMSPYVDQSFSRTFGEGDASHTSRTSFGVVVFIVPNVALTTSAAYSFLFEESLNQGNFSVNSGFSVFF